MRRPCCPFDTFAACGGPRLESPSHFGTPTHLTCVPYARAVSGIDLSGDAYAVVGRGGGGISAGPGAARRGRVLVFAPHADFMNVGHLAVVTSVESARRGAGDAEQLAAAPAD